MEKRLNEFLTTTNTTNIKLLGYNTDNSTTYTVPTSAIMAKKSDYGVKLLYSDAEGGQMSHSVIVTLPYEIGSYTQNTYLLKVDFVCETDYYTEPYPFVTTAWLNNGVTGGGEMTSSARMVFNNPTDMRIEVSSIQCLPEPSAATETNKLKITLPPFFYAKGASYITYVWCFPVQGSMYEY